MSGQQVRQEQPDTRTERQKAQEQLDAITMMADTPENFCQHSDIECEVTHANIVLCKECRKPYRLGTILRLSELAANGTQGDA